MKKYQRVPFEVMAQKYEEGLKLEDGFMPWTDIVTQGVVSAEGLVHVTGHDGVIMCPFVKSRRGIVFIREGDYIIQESNGDKICCGGDKFSERYKEV